MWAVRFFTNRFWPGRFFPHGGADADETLGQILLTPARSFTLAPEDSLVATLVTPARSFTLGGS
jgi:hypothetical protein